MPALCSRVIRFVSVSPQKRSIAIFLLIAIWPSLANTMVIKARKTLMPRVEEIQLQSEALGETVPITVIRPIGDPPKRGWQVLFLLHGLGRNHLTLLQNKDTLGLLLAQPYLIVMPDSGRGWWVNSPVDRKGRYDSMLDEIFQWVSLEYPATSDLSGWGIAGWSMGGFGALHFAERHPDRVSFVGSIIGLLDFPKEEGLPEGQRFVVDRAVFGTDKLEWAADNPTLAAASLSGKQIVIVIADQAFDRTMNENFLSAARRAGLKPVVHHIEGEHLFGSVVKGLAIILPAAAEDFSASGNL